MQQQQQSIESSNSDHNLSELKKEIGLTSALLIEIISHNDKFTDKLKTLNQSGVDAIYNEDYQAAVIYLQQAEKVLQYAASCGKTIDRVLIISTLQNQACAYQRMWDLEKASNYLEAIIYNMNTYLQCAPQMKIDSQMCDPLSTSYAVFSNFVRKKITIAFYYLQFSAVSSQIKKHDVALGSAFKALNVLKLVCEECFNYERYVRKEDKIHEGPKMILRDLSCLKETVQLDKVQKYVALAQRGLRKLKAKTQQMKFNEDKILEELSQFAIGQVMQISPISLFSLENEHPRMRQQVNYLQKIYKAIYISICFFAVATELRLIAFENYIEQKRESSIQFRKSKLYHLNSIILASKYVPCETRYLEHIVKSFTNHYRIDLLELSCYSDQSDEETEAVIAQPQQITTQQSQTYIMKSNKMQTTKFNTFGSQKSFEKVKGPNTKQYQKNTQLKHTRTKKSPKNFINKKQESSKNHNQTHSSQKKSFEKTKIHKNLPYNSVNEFNNMKKSVLTPNAHKYGVERRSGLGSNTQSHHKITYSPMHHHKSKQASKDYGKKVHSTHKSKSTSRNKNKHSHQKSNKDKSTKKQQRKKKTTKLHQEYFIQENVQSKKKKSHIQHNPLSTSKQKKTQANRMMNTAEYLSSSKEFRKSEDPGQHENSRSSTKIYGHRIKIQH